jgi:hypothetical protein
VSSNTLSWLGNTATVSVDDPNSATRTYHLSTTADLRDNIPQSKQITEANGQMRLRSGNDLFDGLFALALEETRQNSVSEIHDKAFNDGNAIACDCFETGCEWNYVWTRDIAYSVDLALALIDPGRSKNSLCFKLSERRGGGRPEIVQDTGTGGSWPVSTDRVVWAMGAWELLKYLDGDERRQFRDQAYEAIVNTIESDRAIVYDARDGLYRGEQSFLDWREQSYPEWTREDTVHIGLSKALSTNLNHYFILRVAAELAGEKGDGAAQVRYQGFADDLRHAIDREFWIEERGLYSSLKNTELDPAPLCKFDLLGSALAVILRVASPEKVESIVANYPHSAAGPPVIWPQQPLIRIYHNRAIWPFVTAYAMRAAKVARNDAVVDHDVLSMMRGAALNLSNMENFEFTTLASWYEDGAFSGPEINSRRQLWSVAGYLSMVLDLFFGREAGQNGIRFRPFVTKRLRSALFAESDVLELRALPYRGRTIDISVRLPAAGSDTAGYYDIDRVTLNGAAIDAARFTRADELANENQIAIELVDGSAAPGRMTLVEDTGDFRRFWPPVEPALSGITQDGDRLRVHFNSRHERDVTFSVYRNGELRAADLPGHITSWVDPDSGDFPSRTYCYAVEMKYVGFEEVSHHSPPQCFWTPGSILEIKVPDGRLVSNDNASMASDHGCTHYNDWGDPDQEIAVNGFSPNRSGPHYIQLIYGNAMGPINTGITAAVKWIEVRDAANGELMGEGAVFMPHLRDWDTWGDSSFLPVTLDRNRAYRLVIKDAFNMSYLDHFKVYTGGEGGAAGPNNRVNLSGIKFLSMSSGMS